MPSKKLATLREQVGQLLIMGFDGTEMSARLRSTIATMQPGGVILFARNITQPQQAWELLRDCHKCITTPAFLCVDMEGGTVDRLKDIIAPAPSPAEVFETRNKKLFRKHGKVIGEEVRALGFNVDFAPVSDLRFPVSASVLSSRTVSPDPKETVNYVREFLRGLKDSRVLGCGKHFPGLGEANLDTHSELPRIKKSWKALWEQDLVPYRTLHRDFPFVMVAHAAYTGVDNGQLPASLSRKWITDILRKKIGYRGLVISDDLEMGGVLATASIGEAAVETIDAGADIFLVCHKEEAVWSAYHAVLSEAESNRKFARRIADAARRVLAYKKRRRELGRHAPAPTQKVIDRLQRDMWEFGEEIRLVKCVESQEA